MLSPVHPSVRPSVRPFFCPSGKRTGCSYRNTRFYEEATVFPGARAVHAKSLQSHSCAGAFFLVFFVCSQLAPHELVELLLIDLPVPIAVELVYHVRQLVLVNVLVNLPGNFLQVLQRDPARVVVVKELKRAGKLLGRVALENLLDDWMEAGVRACGREVVVVSGTRRVRHAANWVRLLPRASAKPLVSMGQKGVQPSREPPPIATARARATGHGCAFRMIISV